MSDDQQTEAIALMKRAIPHLQALHDDAQALHDNYGEHYMDHGLCSKMQEIQSIVSGMHALIDGFEGKSPDEHEEFVRREADMLMRSPARISSLAEAKELVRRHGSGQSVIKFMLPHTYFSPSP